MTAHEQVNDELRAQAALYALGLLEADEACVFAQHLEGCVVCEDEVRAFEAALSSIPLSLARRSPAPELRERLMERVRRTRQNGPQVWKRWRETPARAGMVHVVHAGEGDWQTVSEGVSAKQLYVDTALDNVTMLVRMAPGSTYPAHRHGGPEQCLVLEGDLRTGPIVLHAGDFQCAARDSVHEVTRTEQGCLLLIISSRHDELLPGKSDPT